MARKKYGRRGGSRKLKIPVLGTLIGLGALNSATGGAVASAASGNFAKAGQDLKGALTKPSAHAKAAIPGALAMGAYALVRRRFKPGVNIGPVRIEA